MRKFLLFAIAISLGSIAFAQLPPWPPEPLDQATCDFFGYPNWNGRSVKGCLTCPVYKNGHRVTCEKILEQHGTIDEDCCWLNTPKAPNLDSTLGNCYTNGCVLGPNPWSVKCICKLNCAMSDPTKDCYSACEDIHHPHEVPGLSCLQYDPNSGVTAPNGGNTGNGNNGNIGHNNGNGNKIHKKITTPRPTAPKVAPSRTQQQKSQKTLNKLQNKITNYPPLLTVGVFVCKKFEMIF